MEMDIVKALFGVGIGIWITIVVGFVKITRYLAVLEFKLNILWEHHEDFVVKTNDYQGKNRRVRVRRMMNK